MNDYEFSMSERDKKIFQLALKQFLKSVSKNAKVERSVLGPDGQFSELEDYVEHLKRRVDTLGDGSVISAPEGINE